MLSNYKPIVIHLPRDFKSAELYFAHDVHKGDALHDENKWERFKADILSAENRYIIFCGDYLDNAIVGSKGNIYEQIIPPHMQKEWFAEQLCQLRDRVLAIVPGNHEARTTRATGLSPIYDIVVLAGLDDKYRQHFAFVDIGIGQYRANNAHKQHRYVGFITHRMRDCKIYNGSDFVDGIDFAAYGHDHDAKDHPRAKLVYDNKNKTVAHKNIEVINSGAFLHYGGYSADSGYRPVSEKVYKLILSGTKKRITTVGFYVD